MGTPVPENDAVKKAVKWIGMELKSDSGLKRLELVEKASVRFDLSPSETEYLMRAEDFNNVKD